MIPATFRWLGAYSVKSSISWNGFCVKCFAQQCFRSRCKALIPSDRQVLRSREMDSLSRAVNPVEGEDEKNGAKQSEQQIG